MTKEIMAVILLTLGGLGMLCFVTCGTYLNFFQKNTSKAIKFNLGITFYFLALAFAGKLI